MRKYTALALMPLLLALLCACSSGGGAMEPSGPEAGKVTLTFDFARQSGYASNQFAVWIEDGEGNMVKTLYATPFTAKGGYQNRPDSIPLWVEKSGVKSMEKSAVDVITGATPQTGTLSYAWDLTDERGGAVPPGEYSFFVEGSLRWKNRALYSGTIALEAHPVTVKVEGGFFYEEGEGQPALSEDSPENAMIGIVTAAYIPEGWVP